MRTLIGHYGWFSRLFFMKTSALIKILDTSIKKHGADFPFTLGHLQNILKLEQKMLQKEYEREEKEHMALVEDISYLGQD